VYDSVTWWLNLSVTRVRPAKTAKRIGVLLGVENHGGALACDPVWRGKVGEDFAHFSLSQFFLRLQYANTSLPIHSPGEDTFSADSAKLL